MAYENLKSMFSAVSSLNLPSFQSSPTPFPNSTLRMTLPQFQAPDFNSQMLNYQDYQKQQSLNQFGSYANPSGLTFKSAADGSTKFMSNSRANQPALDLPEVNNGLQGGISTLNNSQAKSAGLTPSSNNIIGKIIGGNKSTGLQAATSKLKSLNANPIAGIASQVVGGLRDLTEQDVEYTGKTSETLNNISGMVENINAQINPLGNAANQAGAALGNLIGGTKDRVKGAGSAAIDTISSVASNFGPIGMAVGTALQLVNGIGGKRVDSLTDMTSDIIASTGSGYSGSVNSVQESIDKYSNKKAGLFDFGFAKKGNAAIDEAERKQNIMLDIGRYQDLRKSNTAAADLAQQNKNKYSGLTGGQMVIGKKGMKLDLSWARGLLFKFQKGGKLGTPGIESNVIVEGAYHAHKNHLDEVNPELSDMTPKGIPVATEDASGNKTQVAEIEVGELILTKDLTDKLEELYKDGSDDAAIQAGILFTNEIIDNTVDNKGGVLDENN